MNICIEHDNKKYTVYTDSDKLLDIREWTEPTGELTTILNAEVLFSIHTSFYTINFVTFGTQKPVNTLIRDQLVGELIEYTQYLVNRYGKTSVY